MTTETDAELVEMLRARYPEATDEALQDWVTLHHEFPSSGMTLEDQRILTWANARRDAAVEIERQCSVEVIATRDAQIDGLTAALTENAECLRLLDTDSRIQLPDGDLWTRVSNARQQARAALEPAAEGGE